MKILNCPLNGPRNISEFVCLGEVKPAPSPDGGPYDWAAYVFLEDNPAGLVREWWMHLPSNFVFIVERDTRTDTIIRTYAPDKGAATTRQ
jgi:sarcosine oxidase subunit delta